MTPTTLFEEKERVPYVHPRICTCCQGTREVKTDIWQEFREHPKEEQIRLFNNSKALFKWFALRDELQVIDVQQELYSLPAETVPCNNCQGTGLFPAQ